MIFNKNKENDDLKRVCTKIDTINESITVLSKNMIGLSIAVNTFMTEVKKELPEFADTIISELNNSLDDLVYIPKSECNCPIVDDDVKDDYVLQVYQRLSKNKNYSRIYKPHNLYFDGYNFINRIGVNRGKISFTIDDVMLFNENLDMVCETLVENNYSFNMVYNANSISKNVFPKFLFNIIEGTFNNPEPFTENPLKKSVNID